MLSKKNCQNQIKMPFQNVDMTFWFHFHQNRHDIVDKKVCEIKAGTHTNIQNFSRVNIFSPEITENKENVNTIQQTHSHTYIHTHESTHTYQPV